MFEKSKRVALGVALTLPVAGAATAHPAAAASSDADAPAPLPYCVTRALPAAAIRGGATSTFTCFPTFPEAMASVGIAAEPDDTLQSFVQRTRSAALTGTSSGPSTTSATGDFLLAVHYGIADAPEGTLPAYMPVGPDCNNYGINIAGTYVDNWIRSTRVAGCLSVKHFDAPNFGSGNTQTIDETTGINLTGPMAGATSSLQYSRKRPA